MPPPITVGVDAPPPAVPDLDERVRRLELSGREPADRDCQPLTVARERHPHVTAVDRDRPDRGLERELHVVDGLEAQEPRNEPPDDQADDEIDDDDDDGDEDDEDGDEE